MNAPPITRDELRDLLQSLLPAVPPVQLVPVATALHLILKAGKLASAAAPKAKPRRYVDKPIAQSLKLKA